MIYLQISDSILADEHKPPVEEGLLERAAQQTLQRESVTPNADITLVLTGDEQLHELNLQFLGIDAPTDVLSFPAGETDPDSETLYLGDVLMSYPRAVAQAEAGGHSVQEELQLLVVHGVLHLLGYDHVTEEEKAAMWAKQSEILSLLGCSINPPPD